MATLTTKFSMGDVVWNASTTTGTFQHKCPDCDGARKWEARSPAGGVFAIPCPRCSVQYHGNDEMRLNYTKFVAHAEQRTIGQIRAISGPEPGVEYMCRETGIGSGNIYHERYLFETKEAALACAEAMAAAKNAEPTGWVAKQFNKTASFSDYQFESAKFAAEIQKTAAVRWKANWLIGDLEGCEDIDAVREEIQRWRDRSDDEWSELEARAALQSEASA